jgi:hypothetical protein
MRVDTKDLQQKVNGVINYTQGFINGIEANETMMLLAVAEYTGEALGLYIDSLARMSPKNFHHVYEWGQVGDQGGRLFEMNYIVSGSLIRFDGKFLPSKTTAPNATVPFVNKAEVMESGISITIEPRNSNFLVFESEDGDTVFTQGPVVINEPGGPGVAGSFTAAVETFFNQYFTMSMMKPMLQSLNYPLEYEAGLKSLNYRTGYNQGKKYITRPTEMIKSV